MKNLKNLLKLAGLLFALTAPCYAEVLVSSNISHLKPLTSNHGYLIIDMDIGDQFSTLAYTKVRDSLAKRVTINLAEISSQYFAIRLKADDYQVVDITSPKYNLPFKLKTKGDKYWRFSVEGGAINYFGRLKISKDRSKSGFFVRRLNYFSKSYHELMTLRDSLNTQYPLRIGMGYKDSFSSFIESSVKDTKKGEH